MATKQQPARAQQQSQLSENEKPQDSPKTTDQSCVVPPDCVQSLWSAQDPNAKAQELFMNFLEAESKSKGEDLNKWDDCESRFEPNELRWIGNFIVNNLVFCKSKLCLENDAACAQILHMLWDTMDLFGNHGDLESQLADRYKHLQNCLK